MSIEYKETFFVVRSYILDLPGMKLSYLRVYEAIFQFWNKKLPCFLNNKTLAERAGVEIRQVQRALDYLEKQGEIIRTQRGFKRYIACVERPIEYDCSEKDHGCHPGHPPMSSRTPPPCHLGHPEYKEIEYKEINTTSSSNFFEQYKEKEKESLEQVNEEFSRQKLKEQFRSEAIENIKCKEVYQKRFEGLLVTLEELYDECADYWSQKNQMVYKARFLTHLKKTPIEKYKDFKEIKSKSSITPDERELIQIYCSALKAKQEPDFIVHRKIRLLKERLKNTDTALAREALVSLGKAEEYACSNQFKKIVAQSLSKSVSKTAREALSSIKKDLK